MSKQGLIYEIICNITGERYIGSTFEPTVARRISKHRIINGCCSKTIIERGDYRYGLLETIFINSRDELRMCERKWYDALECININKPFITKEEINQSKKQYNQDHKEEQKQYYQDHKEEIKQYYQDHKEEIKQNQKQYYQDYKEVIIQYQKQYRQDHIEEQKQYNKQYCKDHREEINQKQKDRRSAAWLLKQDKN